MLDKNKKIRIVDLFAGIGGTRIGVEQACEELGYETECVLSSDKKPSAQVAYKHNFHEDILGEIKSIKAEDVPDHDILIGGFPCQPFSRAGMKRGFSDTRGTMFFEIERILLEKKPKYVLLENVAEITAHDKGHTIDVITKHLENLGYAVSLRVLSSDDFGVPQSRRRAFITGILDADEPMNFDLVEHVKPESRKTMKDIMETGLPDLDTDLTKALRAHYKPKDLHGYVISDKRRGAKTLHTWDIELYGDVSDKQKLILESVLSEFRKRKYATELGVKWRDGMPLNTKQLSSITKIPQDELQPLLDDLCEKGYLMTRHPYKDDSLVERTDLPIGYKLVTSRVSFELNRFLGPDDVCVTLTATDASHIGVVDGENIRRLTRRECLRLFGFPDTYDLSCVSDSEAYDLCGNSICVPAVKAVAKQLLQCD